MKTGYFIRRVVLAFSVCFFSVVEGNSRPLFHGFVDLGSPNGFRFAVSSERDRAPKWLELGGSFEGYKVIEFRQDQRVLVLRDANTEILLPLEAVKIVDYAGKPEQKLIDSALAFVARAEGWTTDIEYNIALESDNTWHIYIKKRIDGHLHMRRVRMSRDGKMLNYTEFKPQ